VLEAAARFRDVINIAATHSIRRAKTAEAKIAIRTGTIVIKVSPDTRTAAGISRICCRIYRHPVVVHSYYATDSATGYGISIYYGCNASYRTAEQGEVPKWAIPPPHLKILPSIVSDAKRA